MTIMTRQQLCAELQISESTLRRHEQDGMPVILVGKRTKRYDLQDVTTWLKKVRACPSGSTKKAVDTSVLCSMESAFTEECRKVQLRVMPSTWKRNS